MRFVRELRPPGIYPAQEEQQTKPLGVADTRIAGFVGIAAKGPMNQPRLIGGWNEFVEVYGQLADSYLAKSVEGFFLNGGRRCYIVRIAHLPRAGEAVNHQHASCAAHVFADGWDKPTLRVRAVNEGRWGNSIWVRVATSTAAKTLMTLDLDIGAGEARVQSVRGFERGALVRIFDRENSDYLIVTEVGDRTIRWSAATPVLKRYRAAGPTYLEVHELEVHATLRDKREVFRNLQLSSLSRRNISRVVNEESSLIVVEDLASKAPLPHNLPVSGAPVRLGGGQDGVEVLTVEDFVGADRGPGDRSGLMALAQVEAVSMMAVPDAMLAYKRNPGPAADRDVQRIQDAVIDVCENLRDRIAVLDAPPTRDLEEIRRWRRRLYSSYAALYYPWIASEGNGTMVPPSGHMSGIYARCDERVGVYKAPANEVVQGVTGVSINMSEDHLGILNAEGINSIRSFPGRGVRVWGARTTADEFQWRYINVRRLFIMLKRALEEGTQWAAFEPNDPATWSRLQREVSLFLTGLWERGYFAGASPEESFFVRCDGSTTTNDLRDQGQMVAEIGIAPALPAEFMIFSLVQKMGNSVTAGQT